MATKNIVILLFTISIFILGCGEVTRNKTANAVTQDMNFEQEKTAIIETLNNETKAAFQRNYQDWKGKWVHDSTITKTYINFPENNFTESIGWQEISSFVKTFLEEHPEPEPVPRLLNDVDVRLYGNGAWVSYEQQDSVRGLKRETRLMEKIDGQWRIAGMHTTIYGFRDEEQ